MTLRTERPPVRARSGRRPLPPLIFLLVLALAAPACGGTSSAQDARAPGAAGRGLRVGEGGAAVARPEANCPCGCSTPPTRAGQADRVAKALKDARLHRRRGRQRLQRPQGHRRRRAPARPPGQGRRRLPCACTPGAGDYQDTRATARSTWSSGPTSRRWPRRTRSPRRSRPRRPRQRPADRPPAGGPGVELGQQLDERRRRSTAPPRSPSARRRDGPAGR